MKDLIAESLVGFGNSWLEAFHDCCEHFNEACRKLSIQHGMQEFIPAEALGSWIFKELRGTLPHREEDRELARMIGAMPILTYSDYWEHNPPQDVDAPHLKLNERNLAQVNSDQSTDVSTETSKEQQLADISKLTRDIEEAIQDHPEQTAKLYFECKAAFVRGAMRAREAGIDELEGPRPGLLTTSQIAQVRLYLFAASFISAWHRVRGDTKGRDKATHPPCTIVCCLGYMPEDAMSEFIRYEDTWFTAMRAKGIGRNPIYARILAAALVPFASFLLYRLWHWAYG